ncbi:MAG: OmpA family protein [Leptospira sp.]|nr:OmpA family protein [Leptospira sp.]
MLKITEINSMKLFLLFFLILVGKNTALLSNNTTFILEGQLINSGLMVRSNSGIVEFTSHSFGKEFAKASTNKIRILCAKAGNKCKPLRYDTEPFTNDPNVADWTLKSIPTYVTKGEFAFNPQVAPDGNRMFWTTLVTKGGNRRSTQKIWTTEKDEYGFWKQGWEMESPLNNNMPSAVISALPGGNELFVFGNFGEDELITNLRQDMEKKSQEVSAKSKDRKEFDYKMNQLKLEYKRKSEIIFNRSPLYKSKRTKTYWSAPEPINFPSFYNTYKKPSNPNQQVFGGSTLSSSGKILIFSAQQKSNYGKLDLYVSFMDGKGEFGEAINIGPQLNTVEEEMAPFLAPDDRTLYFSSSGFGQNNELSIYVTKRIGDGWTNWSTPREISSKLRNVNFFSIPASSDWAYVSREGELFMAKIPADYRPENVAVIQGKVVDSDGKPLEANLQYESLSKKKILGKGVSDPATGMFSLVLPFGDNYGFYAEKEGYLPMSVNKNLSDKDSMSEEGIRKEIILTLPKIQKGTELTLNNLFFETGSSDLTDESEPELMRIVEILKSNPNLKINLEGHTDDVGGDDTNLKLSQARANSVKKFLVEQGKIPEDRITTKGWGSKKPIAKNDSNENRSKNRRVVFIIN